jgi:ERCC4-type nuclease
MTTEILVDLRGKEKEIMEKPLKKMKTPYKIVRTFSDFVLMDDDKVRAVFERKTVADFVSSLGNRMEKQSLTMMTEYPANFLVIVGDIEDIYMVARMKKTPFYEGQFFGAIASFVVRTGLNIIWVKDNEQAITVIDKISKKIIEDKLWCPKVTKKHRKRLRLIALSFAWGVSVEKAKLLIDEFGSIEGVINASEKEIKKLGFSKRTYNSIQELYKG